jgi:hypothetical protein
VVSGADDRCGDKSVLHVDFLRQNKPEIFLTQTTIACPVRIGCVPHWVICYGLELTTTKVMFPVWALFLFHDIHNYAPGRLTVYQWLPNSKGGRSVTQPDTSFIFQHNICLIRFKYVFIMKRSQSQSQSYFTTGGLPPISLSWRQAPWDSRQSIFSGWTLAFLVLM